MFPDENEIRAALSRRRIRPGAQAWPEIARRLSPAGSSRRARLSLAAAFLLLFLCLSLWFRPAPPRSIGAGGLGGFPPANSNAGGFAVTRVESRGRPAAALVLQPDQNTLLVVIPD